MTAKQTLKIIITITAIGLAVVHIIYPKINIDNITVILLGMALVPWVEPLFKSVMLPGGISFDFQELTTLEKDAKKAGLITLDNYNNESVSLASEYEFLEIADKNPELALTSLRIEIEKKLRQLATSNNIHTANFSATGLLEQLEQKKILNQNESAVLKKMLSLLNKAAHTTVNEERLTNWVHKNGPSIINNLEKKFIQLH
jgi:hypothetical protein